MSQFVTQRIGCSRRDVSIDDLGDRVLGETPLESRSAKFPEQAHAAARSRFPLLDLLAFSDVLGTGTLRLPTFVGLIASILE